MVRPLPEKKQQPSRPSKTEQPDQRGGDKGELKPETAEKEFMEGVRRLFFLEHENSFDNSFYTAHFYQ